VVWREGRVQAVQACDFEFRVLVDDVGGGIMLSCSDGWWMWEMHGMEWDQ